MGWVGIPRWTTEIANITGSTEFLNAIVSIVDPLLITYSSSWNIETNTPPAMTNDGVIANKIPARINWPLRSVKDPGSAGADPDAIRAGRMAIRWSDYSGPLRTGLLVYTVNGGDNIELERFVMRIEEATNASNAATRVMKMSVEGEANYGTPIPAP